MLLKIFGISLKCVQLSARAEGGVLEKRLARIEEREYSHYDITPDAEKTLGSARALALDLLALTLG
jgi:hypothetical protein